MGSFYQLSLEAELDLEEIFDYTQVKFGTEQAIKYLSDLEILFNNLLKNPKLGRNRDEIRKNLRSITKEKHVVFYRILEDRIRIVRILHGSRDLPQYF